MPNDLWWLYKYAQRSGDWDTFWWACRRAALAWGVLIVYVLYLVFIYGR